MPTATDDNLGSGNWQVGPAALAMYISQKLIVGTLAQQWWSVGVEEGEANTSILNAQYFILLPMSGGWQIGMTPNVIVNWKADSDNAVTFPVGLGFWKMLKLGNTMTQWSVEGQYSIISPELYGAEWNIRALVKIVLKSPFMGR